MSTTMHVQCECGFVGSIFPKQVGKETIGRCYGCSKIYIMNGERVMPVAEIPKFENFDQLKEFLDKAAAGNAKPKDLPTGKKSTQGKRKQSRNRKAESDSSGGIKHEQPQVAVYKTVHFYVRPGDTWEQVLKDGREEVGYQGPGTMVFAHNHLHGEACTDSCREVVAK